jgi:transposase
MNIPFKKDPEEYRQGMLFPGNLFDLLPKNHCCFVYEDIFQQIDTVSLMKNYSRLGQNAFNPRLITSILIYAYSQGVFSSRQIHQKCKEDISFMYISHRQCPDFRVLSDFRKDNYEFFKECFKQSVLLAMEAGLASFGHVSLDGSKFKANTSKHKAMSYKRLKDQEQQLTDEIDALISQAGECDDEEDKEYKERTGYEIPEDLQYKEKRLKKIKAAKEALEKREQELHPDKTIEDKKQISFADHDARIMGKNGRFDYSYNPQISVDEDNQIIVGQHVSQNATDQKEVSPALEEIQETTGKLPEKMSLDNGFFSGENLETFEESDVDAYVACGRQADSQKTDQNNRKIKKSDFLYDEKEDCFICPQGHALTLRKSARDGTKIYQAGADACLGCPDRNRCCKSQKGSPRTIKTDGKEPLRKAMYEKMQQEFSRAIYDKRKHIVEPVFGQIKNSGFRQFGVRGSPKVTGEFSLVCTAHNFSKIVRAILRGAVCLEWGRLAPVIA